MGKPSRNQPAVTHGLNCSCRCPIHNTLLIYWPAGDDHACQDRSCPHAHGMRSAAALAPFRSFIRPTRQRLHGRPRT